MTEVPTPPTARPPSPPGPMPLGPVPEPDRIVLLDALRGVALLGIFMVNIQVFSMPIAEFFAPSFLAAGGSWGEVVAWGLTKTFFEYKFISLFSLLFGAGMVMQMIRAEQRRRSFAPVYLRRLLVLALIGLAHGFLLWYGDILFLYACLGTILLLCRHWRPKTMLIIAASIIGFFTALNLAFAVVALVAMPGLRAIDMVPTEQVSPPAAEVVETPDVAATPDAVDTPDVVASPDTATPPWSERHPDVAERLPWMAAMLDAGFNVTSEAWIEAETTAYRDGPWFDAAGFRAVSYVGISMLSVFGFGWRVLGMFFVGAAFMKLGMFSTARRPWHRRLAVVGLGIGVPLELANAGVMYLAGTGDRWDLAAVAGAAHELGSVSMCLGLVGATALIVSSGAARHAVAAVAAVGRLALSNYLLQTVMATFVMYFWGLGWFGDVSRPEQIGLVAVLYAIQVAVSVLWLRLFSIGPVEWLWRSLTYLKPQPFVRR